MASKTVRAPARRVKPLERLFRPRTVAVVGASSRGVGRDVVRNLNLLGFGDRISLVNPRRVEIDGRRCVPSVLDLPEVVDAAVIVLSAERVPAAIAECGQAAIPAAVVFANGFAERGEDGAELEEEVRRNAVASGVAVLGPNCMGYLAPGYGTGLYMDVVNRLPRVGPVAVVTQSGSIGVSALNHTGTLGLSAVVSVGNEAVVTTADVVRYLLTDGSTSVVAIYAEGFRDGPDFLSVAEEALEQGVRLVLCKSGRSRRAAEAARSHTGALATDQRVLQAALGARGVTIVSELDELFDAAEILASRRRAGRRLAAATLSGGHVGLLLDLAEKTPLVFPEPAAQRSRIESALGEPRTVLNPLDTWPSTRDVREAFADSIDALAADRNFETVLVALDAPRDPPTSHVELPRDLAHTMVDRAAEDDRLWIAVTTAVAGDDPHVVEILSEGSVPRLNGLRAALSALAAVAETKPVPLLGRDAFPQWNGAAIPRTEPECYARLEALGLAIPAHRVVRSAEEAVAAADELGYPLVAKVLSKSVVHKSEIGGVILSIDGDAALVEAYAELSRKMGEQVLVARQAPEGLDIFVGARVDPEFGPVVAVGVGGTLVEVIDELVMLPAPIAPDVVDELLEGTKLARLLAGERGGVSPDRGALAEAVSRISLLAAAIGSAGIEIDVNPLRVLNRGAIVLDAAFLRAANW